MYNLTIPKEQLSDLWRLREYAAKGPISVQARQAISDYLEKQTEEIGCSITDLEQTIQQHRREERMNQ